MLGRVINLVTLWFVVTFTILIGWAVDWSFVSEPATAAEHPKLWEVFSLWRVPWYIWLVWLAFMAYWAGMIGWLWQEIPQWKRIQQHYYWLLGLSDRELRAVEFAEVLRRQFKVQLDYPLDNTAADVLQVTNRVMRRENYMIALFNKELICLDLPFKIPFIPVRQELTRAMEWNLSHCLLNFVFDEHNQIRRWLVRDVQRERLAEDLAKRFRMMAMVNLIFAPFLLLFTLVYTFYRYGEEVYQNPKAVGTRQYNQWARWKLREFNELPHLFDRRLMNSQRAATRYMEQFHSDQTALIARFIAFISGSLVGVLLLLTFLNEDLLMHFELTPGKSILWFLGFFGACLAIARSLVPDLGQSEDPCRLMQEVCDYTHYLPVHWEGRLGSERVRDEFAQLYEYRFQLLLKELLAILLNPLLLAYSLPSNAMSLIDFFREYTIHVDGMGYVCSFAIFDFRHHGNPLYGAMLNEVAPNRHTREGKMEASFLHFTRTYPQWQPDTAGSIYLARMNGQASGGEDSVRLGVQSLINRFRQQQQQQDNN